MEQEPAKNWLDQEQEQIPAKKEYEKLPYLKFEENKPATITIDFSQPFRKWTDTETKKAKAIIPVTQAGVKMVWFLNILNPIYRDIIAKGKAGQTEFNILQTGTQSKTRYIILK